MLSLFFVDLLTIMGECIDPVGEDKYAALIPDEVKRKQGGQI